MKNKGEVKPGDIIHIYTMFGESEYSGCEGIVRLIDDMDQIYGSWGELALQYNDDWEIIG